MKLVLVPLDDRPCNLQFPSLLPLPTSNFKLLITPKNIMGNKKRSANITKLQNWIKDNIKDADYLIVSLDTLIYGGLIPSRLHHSSLEELKTNLDFIKEIKNHNPNLKILAYLTIMRTPNSNFNSEEPLYYAKYGKMIFKLGVLLNKEQLHILDQEELNELRELKKLIPSYVRRDYISRRNINLNILFYTYELYLNNYFDYFYIPQDDSSPYGFTKMDQIKFKEYIKDKSKDIILFPGADEVGMMMIARALSDYYQIKPKIYVGYSSVIGRFVIPSFEDRMIDLTINGHISTLGGVRVNNIKDCDLALMINIGGKMLINPKEEERIIPYDIERNLADFISQIKYAKSLNKLVGICDTASPSGADMELVNLMKKEDLLLSIDAYASWNTASNTIGTVLANLAILNISHNYRDNLKFLIHRYFDDVGYCSYVRTWTDINAALARGYTEEKIDGKRGTVTKMTRDKLLEYMLLNYPTISNFVKDLKVTSPWNRTFEMEFKISYKGINHEKTK